MIGLYVNCSQIYTASPDVPPEAKTVIQLSVRLSNQMLQTRIKLSISKTPGKLTLHIHPNLPLYSQILQQHNHLVTTRQMYKPFLFSSFKLFSPIHQVLLTLGQICPHSFILNTTALKLPSYLLSPTIKTTQTIGFSSLIDSHDSFVWQTGS